MKANDWITGQRALNAQISRDNRVDAAGCNRTNGADSLPGRSLARRPARRFVAGSP